MSVRTAIRQSWMLTLVVVAVTLWVGFTALDVFRTVGTVVGAGSPSADALGNAVGPTLGSGVVGLAVMLALLALMVVIFGEIEETSPTPDQWPPEEREFRERE